MAPKTILGVDCRNGEARAMFGRAKNIDLQEMSYTIAYRQGKGARSTNYTLGLKYLFRVD
jgi:hypothetical protein